MEQLQYNLLFRWFVGMEMDEEVWNHAVFSKNRERLLNEEIAEAFFQRVLVLAQPYLSDEHFTVDGTRIEAWASQKSFRRKRSEEHTSELQSRLHLVCRLLLEKKKDLRARKDVANKVH